MVLVDLPIDLGHQQTVRLRDGFGGSWWFLTCECDDSYVDIVEEVVSLCSYSQIRAMCFVKDGSEDTLLSRATPKCREVLRRSLRFAGRFEFVGSNPIYSDEEIGLKVFDALDYGTPDDPDEDGRRVILKCFANGESFAEEVSLVAVVFLSL
jgi:hypothetical protein